MGGTGAHPPISASPAAGLLAFLSLGGNKSPTQSEQQKACGCCARRPQASRRSPSSLRHPGEATHPASTCAAGTDPSPPTPAPALLSLPGSKPGSAENWRGKTRVGGAWRSLPCFSRSFHRSQSTVPRVQLIPCPWSGDAKGSHSPAAGPPSTRDKKTKQNRPGSKYYLNIKERDVSS